MNSKLSTLNPPKLSLSVCIRVTSATMPHNSLCYSAPALDVVQVAVDERLDVGPEASSGREARGLHAEDVPEAWHRVYPHQHPVSDELGT